NFVPMDLDIEKEKKKPAKFQQIEKEQVEKDTTGKRNKSLPRKSTRSTTKRQKVELDDEKEDLKGYLDIVPREDVAEDVESLSTKYPIVDWKTYTLSENFMYYKIIRGDGSSKNYKILSEMLYDFGINKDTCPNAIKLSAKKVESSTTSDSNTPVLSPTGLKCSTSNCGSKPTGNKKNDRISRTPSRNMKNKVEAQPRKVNKKNSVVEPIRDVDVKHSLLNANSEPICATCKKSMFDGVHDMCLLDFVENVNSHAKSAKKHKKQNIWKPTGHVFTEVGLKWKPTGRTFTIVGNSCPLTRITSANVVPPKKTTSYLVETQKQELKVYSRKPKNVKNVGSSKEAKIVESRIANHSEPNHTWESNATDIASSSSFVMTSCPDCPLLDSGTTILQGLWDNGTEFVNQTLREFYENVSILHQTSVARTPQQNGVVERQNQTLVEAARTMLIFSKALLFLWAEAINTACYTQNRSLIRLRYNKTPYELMQDKKPDLSCFHVFGALCYPTNDNDELGKLDAKADIGIFVGYASAKKVFRIYNKKTQKIIETIHVTFDELTSMASEQFSSGPGFHFMTPVTSSSGLVPNPVSQQPCIPPPRDDWDRLFQPMFDEYFTPPSIVVLPV
ncbi:retrovirus-related pol polyprotein from transposon TNT 1-94, partial [Tanacetum coccineum]